VEQLGGIRVGSAGIGLGSTPAPCAGGTVSLLKVVDRHRKVEVRSSGRSPLR
jgi:hypothetical protein